MSGNSKGRKRRFGNVRKLPSGRFQARYTGPDGLTRTVPDTFETKRAASLVRRAGYLVDLPYL